MTFMPHTVEVIAPSRLHFGMFAFGHPHRRRFGGVGVMVDAPATRLRLCHSRRLEVSGPHADRVRAVVQRMARQEQLPSPPACRIEVTTAPREHIGLGLGTQLSLAVAAGANALLGHSSLSAEALAQRTGRGQRSAVGTHGFVHGGMIVDAGKRHGGEIGKMATRVELPGGWRFVLMCPRTGEGLSGDAEATTFASLPSVPVTTATALERLAMQELVPAAVAGAFDRFSVALFEYGHRAGSCFAARQFGAYASPRLAALVDRVCTAGVRGVGQSSWGPTLFACLPDLPAAERLVDRFRGHSEADDIDWIVTSPSRHGARIESNE
jgi:beta-ribofuranosylaminobenzene 5'-phosphate synthase